MPRQDVLCPVRACTELSAQPQSPCADGGSAIDHLARLTLRADDNIPTDGELIVVPLRSLPRC